MPNGLMPEHRIGSSIEEMKMGRKILAVVAGLVTGFVLVASIEAIGSIFYPPPAGLDMANTEQMGAYIKTLPTEAYLFVLAAWTIATFGGGLVACLIAKSRPKLFALIIGALLLAAAVFNLVMHPHPTWFTISAVVAIVIAIYLAGRVGQTRFTTVPQQ